MEDWVADLLFGIALLLFALSSILAIILKLILGGLI